MVRGSAVLDVSNEEFIEVCQDHDFQKENVKNFQSYNVLATYKTKYINLEICKSVTHKFVIIDPRESIFQKYYKIDREKGTCISITKAILLKDHSADAKLAQGNVHISGFLYTTIEDPQNKGKYKTTVESYNSADSQSKVGMTIVKAQVKQRCKNFLLVNMDEAHRRVLVDDVKYSIFERVNREENVKDI